jgi:hypothetical protein
VTKFQFKFKNNKPFVVRADSEAEARVKLNKKYPNHGEIVSVKELPFRFKKNLRTPDDNEAAIRIQRIMNGCIKQYMNTHATTTITKENYGSVTKRIALQMVASGNKDLLVNALNNLE